MFKVTEYAALNHSNERIFHVNIQMLGGSMIPGKRVHMYKGVAVRFADLSHLTQISNENEIIWSH